MQNGSGSADAFKLSEVSNGFSFRNLHRARYDQKFKLAIYKDVNRIFRDTSKRAFIDSHAAKCYWSVHTIDTVCFVT